MKTSETAKLAEAIRGIENEAARYAAWEAVSGACATFGDYFNYFRFQNACGVREMLQADRIKEFIRY